MRAFKGLGPVLAGVGALAVCCALGPATIVAAVGLAIGGLGLGSWIAVGLGMLLAAGGAGVALTRRRDRSARGCAARPDPTTTKATRR